MDFPYGEAQGDAPSSYWSQANGDGTYSVYMLGYPLLACFPTVTDRRTL
jgi:hypothetical protein